MAHEFVAPPKERNLLALAHECLDLLADARYDEAFKRFGYAMAYQLPGVSGAKALELAIAECGPDARVTDWRLASPSSGPSRCSFVEYAPNDTGLVSAFSIDLPLNGLWSTAAADFVVATAGAGYCVTLEHIYSNSCEADEPS